MKINELLIVVMRDLMVVYLMNTYFMYSNGFSNIQGLSSPVFVYFVNKKRSSPREFDCLNCFIRVRKFIASEAMLSILDLDHVDFFVCLWNCEYKMYISHDLGTVRDFVVVDIWIFDEFNNQFQHKIHCKIPVKTNHKIITQIIK